ncbi:MAG: arsenite methyltransferase [Actinomycetota bacterium]
MNDIREQVRGWYARAAQPENRGGCGCGSDCGCGADCCSGDAGVFGRGLYDETTRAEAPDAAFLASLGCGNPTAVAELHPGEVVLDLGSGGGLDVILSARRVGPTGKAYGLDMTEEMLALALENKATAGVDNVEFLKGYIEQVPLPAATMDVIISNCVVNLSPDKPRVFGEAFRVLRPGGRLALTDVVADTPPDPQALDPDRWSACIAGALTREEYAAGLRDTGFEGIEIIDTHRVADGYASAIIRARKPESSATREATSEAHKPLPVIQNSCC